MSNALEKWQSEMAAAAMGNNLRKLTDLLWGASAEVRSTLQDIKAPAGRSLLTLAAQKSDPRVFDLLKGWLDLNKRDAYGLRPLEVAVESGNEPVVRALVAHLGAGVLNERDGSGETVAHGAARAGKAPMVRLLLELGADPSIKNNAGDVPAHAAAWEGHRQVIEVMPREALSHTNKEGDTPALLAAMRGHAGVLDALARKGADLTQPDREGNTPLHHAAALGDVDSIKVLLKHAPDSALARNQNGQTPAAVAPPNSGAAKLLTELGAKGLNWKQLLDNAAVGRPAAVTSAIPGESRHSLG